MISVEFSEGITETLDILDHMPKVDVDKIPEKFKNFLEKNKSTTYKPNLDHSKKISEMNLKEKTKDILATIYMSYWCTPQEKIDYIQLLNENERKHQEELREKYNPDNIFKKKEVNVEVKNVENEEKKETEIIKYKEPIFKKIINKIKSFFQK